jgi:hypothetical protein
MAEDKKGFVLYADLIHTINKMPSEKAGDLFKHILSYVNDENPTTDDMLIDLVFEPIKQQLKRDLRKYEDKKLQWSEAGKRSAEVRKLKKEATESTDVKNVATESTVIVKDTVKDKVIDIKEEESSPTFNEFWELYNKKNDKVKSQKKWLSLSQKVKEQIMEYVPKYILLTPDKQFRKNPLTFFNNQSWNDEIETPNKTKTDILPYPERVEFMVFIRDNCRIQKEDFEKYKNNLERKHDVFKREGWIDWRGKIITDWKAEVLKNINHWIKL